MKIKSFESLVQATIKVLTNLVGGAEKKTHSIYLECGKALVALKEKHPDAKSLNAAYREAGGKGKAPDHGVMMANVFTGLVLEDHLDEAAYDCAKSRDCRIASPIINLLAKGEEKDGFEFPEDYAKNTLAKVGQIMTDQPKDSGKQLEKIREEIKELLDGKPESEGEGEGEGDGEDSETVEVDATILQQLQVALETLVPKLGEHELEDAYDLLVSAAKEITETATAEESDDSEIEAPAEAPATLAVVNG